MVQQVAKVLRIRRIINLETTPQVDIYLCYQQQIIAFATGKQRTWKSYLHLSWKLRQDMWVCT
jgi:Zn-dependent protease with chaperone function